MKKLSHREIQQVDLNILKNFADYCTENNLKFYLVGGTLLGAIRHKGFIPWDDDIDIGMPRKDYEQLIRDFPGTYKNRFILRCAERGNMIAPFVQVVDSYTKVSSKYTTSIRQPSLWIDVFPVDGLPEDINQVKKIYSRVTFYRKLLEISKSKYGEGKTLFRRAVKLFLKPLTNLIGAEWFTRKINQIALEYPYGTTDYVGVITYGMYGVGERMFKSEFEKQILVEFEGNQFPACSCWDSYLAGIYGDYMQLPPVEKRQAHSVEAYLLNGEIE